MERSQQDIHRRTPEPHGRWGGQGGQLLCTRNRRTSWLCSTVCCSRCSQTIPYPTQRANIAPFYCQFYFLRPVIVSKKPPPRHEICMNNAELTRTTPEPNRTGVSPPEGAPWLLRRSAYRTRKIARSIQEETDGFTREGRRGEGGLLRERMAVCLLNTIDSIFFVENGQSIHKDILLGTPLPKAARNKLDRVCTITIFKGALSTHGAQWLMGLTQ